MEIKLRVGAVVIKNGSILLVKHKKGDEEYWLLPGGDVEFGESLTQALEREVAEETNLSAKTGRLLFVNDSISPDKRRHIVQVVFLAGKVTGEVKVTPDHRLCDARFFKTQDLRSLTLRPNLKPALIAFMEGSRLKESVYLGKIWE